MRRGRLFSLLLVLLLLCGCRGVPADGDGQKNQTDPGQPGGCLTVYAESEYRYALQQVFSHINMVDSRLEIQWAENKSTADVVITDCVPENEQGEYMVLHTDVLSTQPLEQLTLSTRQGVIGLPVFLHLNGFWYDQLLHSNHNEAVPQSAGAWLGNSLCEEYPTVCAEDNVEALFWGIVAPLYIGCGGTEEELSTGALQPDSLLPALEQFCNMTKAIVLTDQAREKFTSSEAEFWIADIGQIAKHYNYKSNLSQWGISLSVPFDVEEKTQCVVWADMLLIRNTVDPSMAKQFLNLFYENNMLTDLSENTRMPMACQMQYSPSAIPELVQICYTALSSPAMELRYVICTWSEEKAEGIKTSLLALLGGEIDAQQAAVQLCEG